MGAWLRKDLQPLVTEMLSETTVQRRGLLRWEAVRQIIADHEEERHDHTDHLFALISLEIWCRTFLDGQPGASAEGILKAEQVLH
jgi:asparagine synthase (glutamine-hydrolysing)